MAQETVTDVSKSTHSHLEFQQGQEDFRALIDGVEDYGIFLLNPEGTIQTWNAGAARLNGYAASEIIGRNLNLFYTPEDLTQRRPEKDLQEARENGKHETEGWRLRKNGHRYWAHVVTTALHHSDGNLRGYGQIVRDLTERKTAEERYHLLVNNIRDYAIIMLDPSGRVQSWNTGAELIKGYSPQEIIGRHFTKFYLPEDIKSGHPARELSIAASQGRYEEEGWRLRKDGSRFWANVVISRVINNEGRLIGYTKITRDLTERRQIEEALKESEERFRLMVESVKDYAILMLDPTGHIISWNAGAERIKGWKAHEVLGRHFSIFYPPEDVKSGKTEYELEVAQREGRFEDYSIRVKKDGSTFFANVVITALFDPSGRLRGFSKVTRDITDRRRAEEELKKAYEGLEAQVEQRTHALIAANKEMEAFSYSVSHDLRAPLRSMDGFSKALMTYYGDKLDDRGKDFLRRIRESSQHMGHLIDDMLNLSKLGRQEMKLQLLDLSQMVREVVTTVRSQDPTRQLEAIIPEGVRAFGDPALLRIVFENLVQNAWKYSAKKVATKIEFGSSTLQDQQVFYIKDQGAGFDMAFSDKLFQAFQRLHTPAEFPGTGVGLALVKRIINRHGGEVWAEGETDIGATFYFSLPITGDV